MIYELNYRFIEYVRDNGYCNELMDKNINKGRPYFFVSIKVGSRDYLIPFRSKISHEYSYKMPGQSSGLDFTKSIPLISKRIIKKTTSTVPQEYGEFLEKAYKDICSKFTQYIPNHSKIRFTTNHQGLMRAQKYFKK